MNKPALASVIVTITGGERPEDLPRPDSEWDEERCNRGSQDLDVGALGRVREFCLPQGSDNDRLVYKYFFEGKPQAVSLSYIGTFDNLGARPPPWVEVDLTLNHIGDRELSCKVDLCEGSGDCQAMRCKDVRTGAGVTEVPVPFD